MAKQMQLASRYYASVLQAREVINGNTLILTGILPVHRRDETAEKQHLYNLTSVQPFDLLFTIDYLLM
jgi:hypothetical protein